MMELSSHIQDRVDEAVLAAAIEAQEFNLIRVLNPSVKIDGDAWCVLYGENLQDGVAGFGKTPIEAVYAFNRAWHQRLPSTGDADNG